MGNCELYLTQSRTLLMEIDDKWIAGKKYLDMSEYLQWQEEQKQINDQSNIAYIR
jgi:putative transposase